jgi:hypothetical protein
MDLIVMKNTDCSDAHLVVTNAIDLGHTPVNNSIVYTDVAMKNATVLVLCYASKESKGDSADDYVMLAQSFEQFTSPTYSPMRTVYGSGQNQVISNVQANAKLFWTLSPSCDVGNGVISDTVLTNTPMLTMPDGNDYATSLNAQAQNGTWLFCYQIVNGLWTSIHQGEMIVIGVPLFTPSFGVAGSGKPLASVSAR